ncbi:hypothetical protein DEO72_LG2g3064 [Vigna unguiculata]|uniref:Uncharacterized protein n=1 Tax=Vigna unguiculata TaxID=3917 RepID=A0A4D6L2P7_VIGUN|nr:hypothetical protein DEO72_LG2g3064 [Vigna unguiculata]
MTCCHTYRSQPIEHVRETIATDHTPQRQVEFPNTNIVRNVPRLPNSSTQGFLVFIRHPELNSRDAIPSLTRGMSFRAQLEECHVFNPYPELNSRDTRNRLAGNTYRRAQSLPNCLAGDAYRQATSGSEPPTLQTPPGGTTYTTRRTHSRSLLILSLSPGGTSLSAKRHSHQDPTVS